MRGVRACATANAVFLGLACATLGFAACSSGIHAAPAASRARRCRGLADRGGPERARPVAPEAPKSKPQPKTAADCKVLISEITNDPPAGAVALNNAQTARDAGATNGSNCSRI